MLKFTHFKTGRPDFLKDFILRRDKQLPLTLAIPKGNYLDKNILRVIIREMIDVGLAHRMDGNKFRIPRGFAEKVLNFLSERWQEENGVMARARFHEIQEAIDKMNGEIKNAHLSHGKNFIIMVNAYFRFIEEHRLKDSLSFIVSKIEAMENELQIYPEEAEPRFLRILNASIKRMAGASQIFDLSAINKVFDELHEFILDNEELRGSTYFNQQIYQFAFRFYEYIYGEDEDQAMSSQALKGGIDLSSRQFLIVHDNGHGINFHASISLIKEMQQASRIVPVIMGIEPLADIKGF